MADCKHCLHEKVCDLWHSKECQDASSYSGLDGCDYFTGWISVEDEIPVGDCIVYEANSGRVLRGSGTEILAAADWCVTHWMPLPKPPED